MLLSLLSQAQKEQTKMQIGYPKTLQQVTSVMTQGDGELMVLTAQNDTLQMRLTRSSCQRGEPMWTCNTLSREKVIKYVAKYATNLNVAPRLYKKCTAPS